MALSQDAQALFRFLCRAEPAWWDAAALHVLGDVVNGLGVVTKSGYDRTCNALLELKEAGHVVEDENTARFMVLNDIEEKALPMYIDPDLLDMRESVEQPERYPSIMIGSTDPSFPLNDSCGGRLLKPCEYCLSCDRWGKD